MEILQRIQFQRGPMPKKRFLYEFRLSKHVTWKKFTRPLEGHLLNLCMAIVERLTNEEAQEQNIPGVGCCDTLDIETRRWGICTEAPSNGKWGWQNGSNASGFSNRMFFFI